MPRRNDDRRCHSGERRASVDTREPGFDATSILVQRLVDRNRHTEKTQAEIVQVEPECMFLVPSVLAGPSGKQ